MQLNITSNQEYTVYGEAVATFGLTVSGATDGVGLLTRGLVWDCSAIWADPGFQFPISTSWTANGQGSSVLTTWTANGQGSSVITAWTTPGPGMNGEC